MRSLINVLGVMVIISFILYYRQNILLILFAFVILGYLVIVNDRLKLIIKHLNIDDQSFWKVEKPTNLI